MLTQQPATDGTFLMGSIDQPTWLNLRVISVLFVVVVVAIIDIIIYMRRLMKRLTLDRLQRNRKHIVNC